VLIDEHPGAEELGAFLSAYASARLAPRQVAVARIRSGVVEEARLHSHRTRTARGAAMARRRAARRATAGLLAAALVVGGAVSVSAASAPGGPLYGARLWVETASLPVSADARALVLIRQLENRAADVESAARSGDSNAVAAAATAYGEAVRAALGQAGSNPDRLTHLESVLGAHVAVLETLTSSVPQRAQAGLGRALSSSQHAVEQINASPALAPDDHGASSKQAVGEVSPPAGDASGSPGTARPGTQR
jgi:hypothetical protein